jgi:hypothetical protein
MQNGLQRSQHQFLAQPLEQGTLRQPRMEAGAPHFRKLSRTTGNPIDDAFDM